jgi:hypothetical protein
MADAPVSKAGARKGVRVQVPPGALCTMPRWQELADAADLKSAALRGVRVRLPFEVPCNKENRLMESIIVEVRAAEGGEDAKLLVKEQLGAYVRAATLHCL